MDSKNITRVLFAAGGVLAGLLIAKAVGASGWTAKLGIGVAA